LENIEYIQFSEKDAEEGSEDSMVMVMNPKTIGIMYWSLGKLKVDPTDQVFKDLEKIILEFFDEFDIKTINNIFGTKFYTLNRTHDIAPMLVKFQQGYHLRELKPDDFPHITSIIQLCALRTNKRSVYYEEQKAVILDLTKSFFHLKNLIGARKYMSGNSVACVIYAHSKLSLFHELGTLK